MTPEPTDPYSNFIWAIKSPHTKDQYTIRLKKFFRRLELSGSMEKQCLAFMKIRDPTKHIMSYIQFLRQKVDKKELVWATLRNQIKPIKLFCDMNDISSIPWKKLMRGLPSGRRYSHDRAPTIEEIKRIVDYPDRRIKVIVYMMVAGGFRVGAWDYLKWGHVEAFPLHLPNGAKVRIYADEEEEYYTFITPEAYKVLSEWMEFRMHAGEEITKDSWIMCNLWDCKRGTTGTNRLTVAGIKGLVNNAIRYQGLRDGRLTNGKRRYEFKALHGFRKYFKTHAEQVMKPINVEVLMGHSTGISDSYYRPAQKDLLEDYLKATPLLTINDKHVAIVSENTQRIEKEIEDLKAKISQLAHFYIDSGQAKPIQEGK